MPDIVRLVAAREAPPCARRGLAATSLAWLLALVIGWPVSAGAADLLIRSVTVVSAERAGPLADADVLVRDGRIAEVRQGRMDAIPGVPVLDGAGRFLVPGLMDSHVHLAVIPGLGFAGMGPATRHADLARFYETQLPRSLLYHGVTQVLDPVPLPRVVERVAASPVHPHLFHCGPAPIVGGYPLLLMPGESPARQFPYLVDEPGSGRALPDGLDPAEHTPETVVERMHADDAICVKLFFEDGWDLRSDWPLPGVETIASIVEAAHRLGMPVLAHANALDMQSLALDAGVYVLSHGLWNWGELRGQEGVPVPIRAHLDRVMASGTGFQATLRVMDGTRAMFQPGMLDEPAVAKVAPAPLLDWYRTEEGQWFRQELVDEDFEGLPDERIAEFLGRPIGQGERALRYLAEKGHPLLLGSDHPANPGHGNHPGLSTYQELEHMARTGVPLRALLEAATINNARAFGLDDRYGTVEPGKVANLLVLEANPLEEVGAFNRIEWVILDGEAIERESLAATETAE